MICGNCSNWKCEKLSFNLLLNVWHNSIGGQISPGYLQRYQKEARIQEIPFEEVKIGFKYCSAGIFTRFYLMKRESDCKPNKVIEECSSFSAENDGLEVKTLSPLWQICTCETHGVTEVQGVTFAPGLYENQTYTRIPFYEDIRPIIEQGEKECSACGKRADRSIVVRLEKTFCCNKHYLEWWAKHHRKEFRRLNK